MSEEKFQEVGTVGGFHYYANVSSSCSGVLHATTEAHTDGRQIFVCDACGAKCVMKRKVPND